MLIDQIADIGRPLLIFSGGEPLLRKDIFELAGYATEKGLRAAMGTNGTLITDSVAGKLKSCGIGAVAVSLDSMNPKRHDAFRGVEGAWKRAMDGVLACTQNGINIQVNTTVTRQNYHEIDKILELAEKAGARSFHLFFLVPTGRGVDIADVPANMYEQMIERILDTIAAFPSMNIRPVCAPQFLRIAARKGIDLKRWGRGCIAGHTYCRIYPSGEVTPCPYLPINLGNIRERRFQDIWSRSPVLDALRDHRNLKGKCGYCEYRELCGGCRARAYGVNGARYACDGLHQPEDLQGEYLAEEPWCTYLPKKGG